MAPRTIIDKIWDAHVIATREDGDCLLWVDRHLVHEGSHHGFAQVRQRGAGVARPDLTFGTADHYVPTRPSVPVDPDSARMIRQLTENCAEHGVACFGHGHERQGIGKRRHGHRDVAALDRPLHRHGGEGEHAQRR